MAQLASPCTPPGPEAELAVGQVSSAVCGSECRHPPKQHRPAQGSRPRACHRRQRPCSPLSRQPRLWGGGTCMRRQLRSRQKGREDRALRWAEWTRPPGLRHNLRAFYQQAHSILPPRVSTPPGTSTTRRLSLLRFHG